jgi:two-component system CitB family sensor kinase
MLRLRAAAGLLPVRQLEEMAVIAMWRSRPLASQILLGVLGILLITTSLGGILYVKLSGRMLDQQYEQRALGIADTVAQMPEIRDALPAGDPHGVIQSLAERVRRSSDAAYVVVTDRTGLRYSHPNPALIGHRLEEPVVVLDGTDHLGIDNGSLGRSANGRAPLRAADGTVIGEVSVGILETQVAGQLHHELIAIAMYSALALGLGVLASWLLARKIKRVTFGLEPAEIVSLLQEREAMLHGIREGVIGFDDRGRVSVINAEAQRLLHAGPGVVGDPVSQLAPPGRLRELLAGEQDGPDQVALTDDFLLTVNRMPVVLGGRDIGSVVTLRDRTELEALIRELRSVTGLTTALRAQEHEYANRLHVVSGLLELGEQEEAASYLAEISQNSIARAEDLRSRVAPPMVAALLVAKITIAAEQDVRVIVSDDSHLDQPTVDPHALLTVIGNLLDNAIEAVNRQPAPREITVHLDDRDGVRIQITDTGPGIAASEVDDIFVDGYSTKTADGGMRRGLGLALVQRIVRRAGGTIDVLPGAGARFEVWLPARAGDRTSMAEPAVADVLR